MNVLISVVIPVHNRSDLLLAAIASVKSQAVDVEIILVDDASTDNTPDVIRRIAAADPDIVYHLLEKNRGGGYARNIGIAAARGSWIAFLDSDDVWLPGKLQAQLTALQSSPIGASLCFTNLLIDYQDGNPALPWNTEVFKTGDSAKEYLLSKGQVIQTSTILMSTSAAKQIRFNETLRRHQDIDFVIRCEKAGLNFCYLAESLVRYSADPKAMRVSKRINAAPSLRWLEVAKQYLSVRELDNFYLQHVFDMHFKDAPIAAILRGITAVKNQAQSATGFAGRVARQLIPQFVKRLRNAIRGR